MTDLISHHSSVTAVELAGQIADRAAAANVFADYVSRQARNTITRQAADLLLFADFLDVAGGVLLGTPDPKTKRRALTPAQRDGLTPGAALRSFADALYTGGPLIAGAWYGVSWGLVESFRNWMLQEGYAVGSVNVRLATLKRYADLASKAGALTPEAAQLIRGVRGYQNREGRRINEDRDRTRISPKKEASVSLSDSQVRQLKAQPTETPQGRRDAVLMCLLLDHGLRCGELALLQVSDFDLKTGTFTFQRPKVDKRQTHRLSADTLRAVRAYFKYDAPPLGPLLLGSRKNGKLDGRMSERAINSRVRTLGEAVGAPDLSPHDCRHSWATRAARKGTDPFSLQEAGGWNSLAMPRRYVEDAKIANEGVKLDDAE